MTLLLTFACAIILMVTAISRWHVHPFLSILGVSLLISLVIGLPLDTIPITIGKGFSSIFSSIGLVIILGMLIGLILERTNASLKLADTIMRLIGPRYPQLAMLIVGWIISFSVFCDSGFVIIDPIRRSLAKQTRVSSVSLTMALSAGLLISHVLIPPTPGPIAAAGMMGLEDNLLLVIGLGMLVSVPGLITAHFFARHIGKRVKALDEQDSLEAASHAACPEPAATLPSFTASFLPIIVPILFMTLGSLAGVIPMGQHPHRLLTFLGQPFIALSAGFICSLWQLHTTHQLHQLYDITQNTLGTAGPIIFVTAAGSVLGTVIVEAGFVEYIKQHADFLNSIGIVFPFMIAAILKTAQGSSAVAIITTASMMGLYTNENSIMSALGMTTPLQAALMVMSIGAGAMAVSHVNDSYFWVVTNFGKLTPQDGYKTQTLMTLLVSVSMLAGILVINMFVRP